MKLSIIIPTLNEAPSIAATLQGLAPLREAAHEVIVVDGHSSDETGQRAKPHADTVLTAPRGRAVQMNAGADVATGEILLFLHADTELPNTAASLICRELVKDRALWGRFDVRLSGRQALLRSVAWLINLRSRLSGIATGDQAMFVRREIFERVGGFPEIALMEDIALSRKLKRLARPRCLRARVSTSSRRWEQHGVLATILRMWRLRLAYSLGADPAKLAAHYPTTRQDAAR